MKFNLNHKWSRIEWMNKGQTVDKKINIFEFWFMQKIKILIESNEDQWVN